ncbi:GNAT family N-acetyltransferase [Ideonella sp. DXS29W]|uniref:GNAT family N-acetyltransferase n=1 Tax=Ideonella lacteola TaxID=2984193 RepID=A0ABU9BIN0_9BURK
MAIREIDPSSDAEISLVAERMLDTLIEVEGPERGIGIHSLPWLKERVQWHLDPSQSQGQVFVATATDGHIVGHSLLRIEGRASDPFGLVATTYIIPSARRSGWAGQFLERAHGWFREQGVNRSCTWTSGTNTALISLYRKFGYDMVDHGPHGSTGTPMVKLGRYIDDQQGAP